jgi:hypothetical protein
MGLVETEIAEQQVFGVLESHQLGVLGRDSKG